MQESAAQWLHQAVPAYNTLLDYISSLPYEAVVPGEKWRVTFCRLHITLQLLGSLLLTSCVAPEEASWFQITAALCMHHAGLGLPQMLKCEWRRAIPTIIQIPFPEGDSLEQRLADATRRSKYQHLQPQSKAALTQLFGDDFDLGKPIKPYWHHFKALSYQLGLCASEPCEGLGTAHKQPLA